MSEYVRARQTLLDALAALGPQRAAVVLCGAQAVYMHVGEDEFAISPFTSDADIMLSRADLLDEPVLRDAMEQGGFRLDVVPGIWRSAEGIEVDLLVPEAQGGAGRRSAKLGPPHGNEVARKVRGLEAALVDNMVMHVTSLDPSDPRAFDVRVAGPAALVVSKLHKIHDRTSQASDRISDKDALDFLRILRAVQTDELGKEFVHLLQSELSGAVTVEAISLIRELFSEPNAVGTIMAVRATHLLEDPDFIAQSCVTLARALLQALGSGQT